MSTILRSYSLTPSVWYLHDGTATLEKYFNDIYHLFLNRLVKITHETVMTPEEQAKLSELFQELLKVKSLLQKDS